MLESSDTTLDDEIFEHLFSLKSACRLRALTLDWSMCDTNALFQILRSDGAR